MTREELIKQCRYYKGEKECPSQYSGFESKRFSFFFWIAEKTYCNSTDSQRRKSANEFFSQFPLGIKTNILPALAGELLGMYSKGRDMTEASNINGFEKTFISSYLN